MIILGIILGLMLSIVGVLLRSLFNRGESPQALEEHGIASMPVFHAVGMAKSAR
ncbi:hypothetical protein KCP77_11090 [Salmonella enterica subsp. enterica]|nr:hypothetical protein KCP77_11090 [Salmonella enterica subsp. enterica]